MALLDPNELIYKHSFYDLLLLVLYCYVIDVIINIIMTIIVYIV